MSSIILILHVPFRMLGFSPFLYVTSYPDYTMYGGNIRDAGRIGMNGESVNIPTKRLKKTRVPTRHSFVFSIPSFWSKNHHPEPKLDFSCNRSILEVTQHSCNHLVCTWIQVVEDCLRQFTVCVQAVEEFSHCFCCCNSPIESKPVSGPNNLNILVLLLRIAP